MCEDDEMPTQCFEYKRLLTSIVFPDVLKKSEVLPSMQADFPDRSTFRKA